VEVLVGGIDDGTFQFFSFLDYRRGRNQPLMFGSIESRTTCLDP
jgi:hypothetical protein